MGGFPEGRVSWFVEAHEQPGRRSEPARGGIASSPAWALVAYCNQDPRSSLGYAMPLGWHRQDDRARSRTLRRLAVTASVPDVRPDTTATASTVLQRWIRVGAPAHQVRGGI